MRGPAAAGARRSLSITAAEPALLQLSGTSLPEACPAPDPRPAPAAASRPHAGRGTTATPDRVGEVVRRIDRTTDEKLLEIVAAIDRMPERGEADALIAPFRPRLARLQPTRPTRLQRLLYAPLDMVITDTGSWTPDRPAVPRAALQALTGIVRRSLGAQFDDMQATVAATGQTPARAEALGRRLWPVAGRLLLASACPPDWSAATGLAPDDFPTIRDGVGQLLQRAVELNALVAGCGPPLQPTAEHIRTALDELAYGGAAGFRLAVVVLLRRCPRRQDLAAHALSTGRHSDAVESAAMSGTLYALQTAVSHQQREAAMQDRYAANDVDPPSPRELTAEVEDAAALLRGMEVMTALRPRSRMQREVSRTRPVLQAACLERFRFCVDHALLEPLAARLDGGGHGFGTLVATAAELATLCEALGQLGDRYGPERVLHDAAGQVHRLLEAGAVPAARPLLALLSTRPAP